MKKILFAICFMLLVSAVFGATTGNGTCTLGSVEGLTGQDKDLAFTYTVATNNMVAGNIKIKVPAGFPAPTVDRIAVTGSGTEKSAEKVWYDGTNWYIGVTVSATTSQTVIITWQHVTMSATAGSYEFTTYSKDAGYNSSLATAIGDSPDMKLWNAYNPVTMMTIEPTVVLPVSALDNLRYQFKWTVSPIAGAEIKWSLAKGTPGYQNTPNPVTMVANGTDKTNAVRFISTPSQYTTPACDSNGCSVFVLAAATIVIDQVVEIRIGQPTGTPVAGVVGSNYAKNMQVDIYVDAGKAVLTQTPVAMPTYGGQFLVQVATPTCVMTVTGNSNKKASVIFNSINSNAKPIINIAGTPVVYLPNGVNNGVINTGVGSYALTLVQGFYDYSNDGAYRTVTSNATTIYSLGNFKGADSIAQINAAGFLNKEYSGAFTMAAAGQRVTNYAQDMLMFPMTICGTLTGIYSLNFGTDPARATADNVCTGIGGNLATTCTAISPAGGVFYLPSQWYQKLSCTVGASDTAKYISYYTCKVSDWAKIEGGK